MSFMITPQHPSMGRLSLLAFALTAFTSSACPDKAAKKTGDERREAKMTAIEIKGDTEIEKYDLDGDGKEDVWKYFVRVGDEKVKREKRPRLLAKKELDLNHDGSVDMSIHYNKFGEVVRRHNVL